MLMTDASKLYLQHSVLLHVSRDTVRIVSRYAMTADQAKAYAISAATHGQASVTASVTIANGFVTVVASTPSADSAPLGIMEFAVGSKITATSTSTMEPA